MSAYQIISIVILIVFYISYLLKGVALKKHGITTNRLAKGNKPQNVKWLECCLLFVTYSMVVVQIMSIYLLPPAIETPLLRIIGLTVASVGVMFFVSAIIVMKDNWRAGIDNTQKTKLVQTGVYKYSRNPAFVGFDLLYMGIALSFPNTYIIFLSILGVVLFHMQIEKEEKYLKTIFGENYINYMASVNRYLGKRK